MKQDDLLNAGLDYIKAEDYSFLTFEQNDAFTRERKMLADQREKEEFDLQLSRHQRASDAANADLKAFAEEAKRVYTTKICVDPKFVDFEVDKAGFYIDLISHGDDKPEYPKRRSVSGIMRSITGTSKYDKWVEEYYNIIKKLGEASLPDEDILREVVAKHAEGDIAEYCNVIPYIWVRDKGEINKINPDLTAFFRRNKQAMDGVKRLQELETRLLDQFRKKRIEEITESDQGYMDSRYEAKVEAIRTREEVQDLRNAEEILPLVKKLLDAPEDLREVARFTCEEIRKRDSGMDKGNHVALIDYTVRFAVSRERIDYYYDSNYTNPRSSFIFEKNNFKPLGSDTACCAIALALGELVCGMLRDDPAFEMADIRPSGIFNTIDLHVSYPNPAHTQMKILL